MIQGFVDNIILDIYFGKTLGVVVAGIGFILGCLFIHFQFHNRKTISKFLAFGLGLILMLAIAKLLFCQEPVFKINETNKIYFKLDNNVICKNNLVFVLVKNNELDENGKYIPYLNKSGKQYTCEYNKQ